MMKEKNKNKAFIKEVIVILFVGILVNLACFFMCSITGHCATNTALPYQANTQDGYSLTQEEYSTIIDTISDFGYTLDTTNIIVFRNYRKNWYTYNDYVDVPQYVVYELPSNSPTMSFSSGYSYDTFEYNNASCYITASSSNMRGFTLYRSTIATTHNGWAITASSGTLHFQLFGSAEMTSVSNTYFSGSYNNYYPVYVSTIFTNQNGDEILTNIVPVSPGNEIFNNAPLTGHAINPTQPTAPTITAPQIDSSNTVIENIQILFSWLGTTIKDLLTWLINQVLALFTNLITNIKAFIDAVITAINNGFMNIYMNFTKLFGPYISLAFNTLTWLKEWLEDINENFFDFIRNRLIQIQNYISTTVDTVIGLKDLVQYFFNTYGVIWNQETWEETLDQSPWLDAVSDNTTTLSQFINGTLNVAEPQELVFTLDFRNAHYNFGLCTFDFNWYQPYKHAVRLAFLCICVLNAVLYFFDEAPNWFSGGGSNKKGDK